MSNNNGNGNGENTSWKVLVIQTFAKSGPWALLCVIILGALWYELDKWVGAYISAQSRYIATSTEAINTLQKSTVFLQETVARNTERFATVAENVSKNEELNTTQLKLMQQANAMMKDVPERSARTVILMERLESLLKELQNSIEQSELKTNRNGQG